MKKFSSKLNQLLTSLVKFTAIVWLFSAKIIGSFILLMIVLIVVLTSIFSSLFSKSDIAKSKFLQDVSDEKIAVVRLQGEIMIEESQNNLLSFTPFVITPDRTKKTIEEIKANPAIKAVVLRINSPGGSVVSSQEVFDQFYQLRQTMPVVAYFEEMAASGGYYIGSAASKIVAHPATLTGSIGVIMISPNITGLYDKLGIKIRTYQSGEFKDMGSMMRDATQQEQEIFASLIKDNYQMFVNDIANSRNMDITKVKQLADGRIYSGRQAVDCGLADQLGNLDTAIDEAAQLANIENPSIIEVGHLGFWDSLLNSNLLQNRWQFLQNFVPASRKSGLYYLWQ